MEPETVEIAQDAQEIAQDAQEIALTLWDHAQVFHGRADAPLERLSDLGSPSAPMRLAYLHRSLCDRAPKLREWLRTREGWPKWRMRLGRAAAPPDPADCLCAY